MTCDVCHNDIAIDDRYCSACGSPKSLEAEPTLLDEVPHRVLIDRAVDFDDTLQRAVGAEYEILGPIGEGGFARVYKARDRRLDRVVAIKVIKPDLAGASAFVDRFRREGVALAKLRHPGIVPIYDIRESEGIIYYVMPFVEGETLGQRMDRLGRLPPKEAQRILSELSDALAAAHRAGVVHRDIKPANVILEGNLTKALLMDFGIATVMEETDDLTAVGTVVGTPAYMSPEQAAGLEELDHRSDIYSLGVMGYRMLTGKLPFDGATHQELIIQHIRDDPVPLRDVNASVPKNFADAIMRCLAKDPWERFGTAMELWSELQTVSFFPTRTEPEASTTGTRTSSKRLAGIVAVGLAAGFMIGRTVYGGDLAPVPTPAEAFVSGWLDNVIEGQDPNREASRLEALAAFDSGATVMRTVAGAGTRSTFELNPRQFQNDEDTALLLASVARRSAFRARTFRNVAIVSGTYGVEQAACGTAWFVLRADHEVWRLLHVRLQDLEPACVPGARDPPNAE